MATPLPEIRRGRRAPPPHNVDSSSSFPTCLESTQQKSPILIFLLFHKAIRNELDALHSSAMAFAIGGEVDIGGLTERYCFLRSMYKHHTYAEDEIIFPTLDIHVKNVAQTYSLEHKGESNLFNHLFDLLNSNMKNDESFLRELASCTGALLTSISQHMSKEEEQVFRLLIEKLSVEEQASLGWQFLCSIPVNIMAQFLPWLSSSLSSDDYLKMQQFLRRLVPEEWLLQKVVFNWMEGRSGSCMAESCIENSQVFCNIDSSTGTSNHELNKAKCACDSSRTGEGTFFESTTDVAPTTGPHPINEILLWHNAIKRELNEIAEEAKKIQMSGEFTNISAFNKKLQFIAEVYIFHSMAEDNIIFPAVNGEVSFFQEHAEDRFSMFRCLIDYIQYAGEPSASDTEFYAKLCSHTDQIICTVQRHFDKKEAQVLPLARKYFSFKRQRQILYQSLCVMPLKLVERVFPWLVESLTEGEAKDFLKNMQLGAPATDNALITLFSGWACKGHNQGICLSSSGISCCPVKMLLDTKESSAQSCCECLSGFSRDCPVLVQADGIKLPVKQSEIYKKNSCNNLCCHVPGLGVNSSTLGLSSLSKAKSLPLLPSTSSAPCLNSSLFVCKTAISSSDTESAERPIDTIFKFHKAICKDLDYLDVESRKLGDCDETFLQQFIGRFRLLWGLYSAHSNAEDDIVFPALESKEVLHNVSYSYTLDHKQEEKLFEDISCVLSELSQLHKSLEKAQMMKISTGSISEYSGPDHSDCTRKYNELTAKLQGMCKSIKVTLEHHIFREEHELWPLFGSHFSLDEQDKLVGRIIGTTGAEVLQSMLPWVTSALSLDERDKMMDTWKQAAKNTMFNVWLSECMQGSPVSTLQTQTLEACISQKGVDFQESLEQDQMFKPGWKDIFRMNQNELESEIRKVYRDSNLDSRRKAYLVQNLMTSRWIAAQQKLPHAIEGETSNCENVMGQSPSFQDPEKQVFGCEHYRRNCKVRAACCGKLFTCRFCHDKASNHSMDRKATSEMMCMFCLNIQAVGPVCMTPSCNGRRMAKYYCNICKFFDDQRTIYHCPFCNLCRVGMGLGIDIFHCMTCNCCLGIHLTEHKCLEKSLEIDCPICCDFLFTSNATVRPLPCGHYMHSTCFQAYASSHYTCPVCSKSMGDMAVYFGMLDGLLAAEELPEEYKGRSQDILCNDCDRKGTSRFHWLYHKCGVCGSYNTRVIKNDKPICDGSTSH